MIQPIEAYLETFQPEDYLRKALTPLGSQRTLRIGQEHTPGHSDGMTNDKEFHARPQKDLSSWQDISS
jgi:hypothetical protein